MSTDSAIGSFAAWWLASRPKTLPAAIAPVLVGAAVAWAVGGFRLGPVLGALAGAIWIQIGTNFANDVFDFESGADDDDRLGPTRAVQAGLLSPTAMRGGMVFAFVCAAVCGAYLTWMAGWPIVIIGVLSILAGIAYTGGPYPLGYNGLGDVFVFVFFGLVAVSGTAYAQMRAVPEPAWWCGAALGALATAILVVNNVRDRETDARVGKRTLVARFGRRFGEIEYQALLVLAYAVPIVLVTRGTGWWVLLSWSTLPLALRLSRAVGTQDGAALNAVLASTAKLLVLYAVLLALGLVLG